MEGFLASEQAFSRFYRANAEALLVFFTRRTFDPQIALDLVAETFMQAFAGREGFRGSGDAEASAWLFAIARRQLARYFESGRIRRGLRQRLAGGTPAATDAELERIEELASLHDLRAVLREQLGEMEPGSNRRCGCASWRSSPTRLSQPGSASASRRRARASRGRCVR